MKTLDDHVIIYDDECPMCNLYTRAFVKTKMLDENGRQAYSVMNIELVALLDQQKACNEIALVNTNTKNVLYGIDSLFHVLGHSFPFMKPIFRMPAVHWISKRLYSFISYNRKIIAPAVNKKNKNQCTPTLDLKYRWLYIAFVWIVTSLVLNSYSPLLLPLVPKGSFYREFAICGGQILFQSMTVSFLRREKLIDYLGNMMTVSLIGALLLIPVLIIGKLALIVNPYFYMGYFMIVVGLMILEHMRRVKLLSIHWSATLSWIIYRLLVLTIIL